MLSWEPKYHELSEDSKLRLDGFYRRFCEGRLGAFYGPGHLIYACHAAFPLMLSPELANLIWINFRNYYSIEKTENLQVDLVAVADFLSSPLCREVGFHRYEVLPEIRSFLLMLLAEGEWFKQSGIRTEGSNRLTELAAFLRQYLSKKVHEGKYDGAAFRQLNEWAVQAWLKPSQLAANIARAFADKPSEKGQLWLSLQMEKLEMQYQRNVNRSGDIRDLRSFYQVFYYGKARTEELLEKVDNAFGYAQEIPRYLDNELAENEITVRLPLAKSVADRTERKINDVQRVIALFLGNDEVLETNFMARDPIGQTIDKVRSAISKSISGAKIEFDDITVLIDAQANAGTIPNAIAELYKKANNEDIVLLFFSGNAYNNETNQIIWAQPVENSESQVALTNLQFNEIVKQSGKNCQTVIILDTSTGYFNWGRDADIFIGGTRNETQRKSSAFGGLSDFLFAFLHILSLDHRYSYRDLSLCIRAQMHNQGSSAQPLTGAFRAGKPNLNNQFLSQKRLPAAKYPLLMYSERFRCWRVVDEDFKILTLNGGSEVFDFEEQNQLSEVRGEIFINRTNNIIQFGGQADSLEQEEVYRVKSRRHELEYEIIASKEDSETIQIVEMLDSAEFDDYSKWGTLKPAGLGSYSLEDFQQKIASLEYFNILLIEILHEEEETVVYRISVHEKSGKTPAKRQLESRVGGRENILPAINKLVRYRYLSDLQLPTENHVLFEPLNLHYDYYWNSSEKASIYNDTVLDIAEDAFMVKGGEVSFKEIILNIKNEEYFVVFFDVYLMVSDLTIKQITRGQINQVAPGETISISINEPQILDKLLSQVNLELSLKILTSRDPIQVEFSQTI